MTQHPDEGTLHAYMDGELPRGEAEALEAHVAECASCSTALAEARGLVAAASRTIIALDAAPSSARTMAARGSAAATRRSAVRPPIFRVPYARAAALLLLVGGTALVIDRSGTVGRKENPRTEALLADAAPRDEASGAATPEAAIMTAPANAAQPAERELSTGAVGAGSSPPAVRTTAPRLAAAGVATDAATGGRRAERTMAPAVPAPLAAGQDIASATSQKQPVVSTETALAGVVAAAPPPPLAREATLSEAAAASAPMTVARVTHYRTSGGKILTLTQEPLRTSFAEESAVTRRSVAPRAQRNAAAAMSAPALNSYRWSSAEQGLTYTLAGPLTVAELEALSKRLHELERVP
ncbi:MAG: anti-sigma factor family protein [Gemmatimonadaceae bacterium]